MQMRQQQGSRSTTPGPNAGGIAGFFYLTAYVVGGWALICVARLGLTVISLVLAPADWSTVPGLAANIFENVIFGLFAGLLIGAIQAWGRKPGKLAEAYLSALFNKNLAEPDLNALFWGRVLLGGTIGWAVGWVTGGAGIVALPPSLSGAAQAVLNAFASPLVLFIGGGFGGPGGTGLLSFLFLIIVILMLCIVAALLASVLLHLALYGVMGMTKGAVKAYVVELLKPRADEHGEKPEKVAPLLIAMQRGFAVGIVLGICEVVFTAWGILTLTR